MEDVIAYAVIVALVALSVLAVYKGVSMYKKRKQELAEKLAKRQEILTDLKKDREATWQKLRSGATHVGKTTYDYNADKSRTTVTERDTGKRVSYVHENDSGPDLLTTMIVADMLLNQKESSAGTVSWKDDVPSVKSTSSSSSSSSWGLDDDDSRRSASSSFSSSWSSSDSSSSSSSDSWSSSSDSGPSSDW